MGDRINDILGDAVALASVLSVQAMIAAGAIQTFFG